MIFMKSPANAGSKADSVILKQFKTVQNRWRRSREMCWPGKMEPRRRHLLSAVTFRSNSLWAVKSPQLNAPLKNFNQNILPVHSTLIYITLSQSRCG